MEPTPQELVDAVRAVQATSADSFEPEVHSIVERTTAHVAAVDRCEEVLRRVFTERELERLAKILADMHRGYPLDGGDEGETWGGFPEA